MSKVVFAAPDAYGMELMAQEAPGVAHTVVYVLYSLVENPCILCVVEYVRTVRQTHAAYCERS